MAKTVSRRTCLILVALSIALGAGIRPAADFVAAQRMDPPVTLSPAAQERIALHEAAHAVTYRVLNPKEGLTGLRVSTTIRQSTRDLGYTGYPTDPGNRSSTVVFNLTVVNLASMAAEIIFTGDTSVNSQDDLARANSILAQACGRAGMCGTLLVENEGPRLEVLVGGHLLKAYFRASTIVRANQGIVQALATAVMSQPVVNGQRSLDAKALAKFFAEHPVKPEPPENRQIAPIVNEVEQ